MGFAMSILINKNTRLLIQGITGNEGLYHAREMLTYGTNLVAGVTPGKGGDWVLDGKVPVFDTVRTAVEVTGANTSVVFVPARFAPDAIMEAASAGVSLIVCITEGIPVKDMVIVRKCVTQKGVRLIGPNSPGIITPGEAKAGIIPGSITKHGTVGVVSRSGTLTYEVLFALLQANRGVSTCVGIGGDAIIGSSFISILEMFEADPHTEQIILIGEIGGMEEERAAEYITRNFSKPVIGIIAGITAPTDKRMGHAGAIIEGGSGQAKEKIDTLEAAGVRIAQQPEEVPDLLV